LRKIFLLNIFSFSLLKKIQHCFSKNSSLSRERKKTGKKRLIKIEKNRKEKKIDVS